MRLLKATNIKNQTFKTGLKQTVWTYENEELSHLKPVIIPNVSLDPNKPVEEGFELVKVEGIYVRNNNTASIVYACPFTDAELENKEILHWYLDAFYSSMINFQIRKVQKTDIAFLVNWKIDKKAKKHLEDLGAMILERNIK